MSDKVAAIIGVGPGNGAAFARKFGQDHAVALLSRSTGYSSELASELNNAKAYACDVANGDVVDSALAQAAADLGPITTLIFNAGSGSWGSVEDISAEQFETSWRINTLGFFNAARAVIPGMKANNSGAIIAIGATASRRGAALTAAFAPAKAAQRTLAESMAKHLGPVGIHVSLIIIDGAVDLPGTRERMPDKTDDFFVKPADVAETAYWLANQPRSAWSFEVEARPFGEKW
jgi:NAD(P)-dependent dehydrogenase (short-subunit alcohol dehydrogenase family)